MYRSEICLCFYCVILSQEFLRNPKNISCKSLIFKDALSSNRRTDGRTDTVHCRGIFAPKTARTLQYSIVPNCICCEWSGSGRSLCFGQVSTFLCRTPTNYIDKEMDGKIDRYIYKGKG